MFAISLALCDFKSRDFLAISNRCDCDFARFGHIRSPVTREGFRRALVKDLWDVACPANHSTEPHPSTTLENGRKSCRTKVPQIFRVFVPNFAPNHASNFPIFRGFFVLDIPNNRDHCKFTKKSPPFFNAIKRYPRATSIKKCTRLFLIPVKVFLTGWDVFKSPCKPRKSRQLKTFNIFLCISRLDYLRRRQEFKFQGQETA